MKYMGLGGLKSTYVLWVFNGAYTHTNILSSVFNSSTIFK